MFSIYIEWNIKDINKFYIGYKLEDTNMKKILMWVLIVYVYKIKI